MAENARIAAEKLEAERIVIEQARTEQQRLDAVKAQ